MTPLAPAVSTVVADTVVIFICKPATVSASAIVIIAYSILICIYIIPMTPLASAVSTVVADAVVIFICKPAAVSIGAIVIIAYSIFVCVHKIVPFLRRGRKRA